MTDPTVSPAYPPPRVVDGLEVLPPLSIRRAWAILVVLGLATGILAGVSVAADEFPIEAPAAFFACLGVLVLMATLVTWGRTSAPDSRDAPVSSPPAPLRRPSGPSRRRLAPQRSRSGGGGCPDG